MSRIKRGFGGFIIGLMVLAFLPASARADFQREVTMNMTEMEWTRFTLYMPAEVLSEYGLGCWQEKWHTSAEDAAGKDEVFMRMDVAETTEIWLEGEVRGYLEYDLLDSSGNLLVQGFTATRTANSYFMLAREVFPAGTYYWRFHDYEDWDCVGMCTIGIRAADITKVEDDDRDGNNNSKAAAVKIEENTPARGYLSRFEEDQEDWYYFNVDDASSERLTITSSNIRIGYELFDEDGNCIMQEDYAESGPGELQLPDGNYYVRLTPRVYDMYPDDYTGGTYTSGINYGGSYKISYSQTKNVHLVPATSIVMEPTAVTINADPMSFFYGPKVKITATLLPENTTDTIEWSVGD